jgi:virginiamycin B lyase
MLLEKTIYRIGLTLLVAISTAGSINVSWAADAPTDDGAALTQSMCSSCHSYNLITQSSGYTKQGWQALIASMIDLSALPEQQAIITDYLAKKFPPHNKLSPSLVDGELDIILEDWVVPTPGQRPRDPVQAADGSIWWAGQWGNLIGRIDPNTRRCDAAYRYCRS